MPKNKIIEDLAPICRLPQGDVVQAVGEYFKSLMENSLIKRPPLWDDAGRTSLQARECTRMNADRAEEDLQEARKVYDRRRKEMDLKWESFREKQLKFRYTFIKFNKLLIENQNKRERAKILIELDSQLMKKKSEETEEIRKELETVQRACKDMENFIDKHAMFKDYLMSVTNVSRNFRQPLDILNTFESLVRTKNKLSKREETDLASIIELRSVTATILEARLHHLMTLNNTLAQFRIDYGEGTADIRKWEGILARIYKITSHTEVELSRIRDSLWDFYCTICKQKGVEATASPDDFDGQLIFVYKSILELRAIVKVTNELVSKEMDSNIIQSPDSEAHVC